MSEENKLIDEDILARMHLQCLKMNCDECHMRHDCYEYYCVDKCHKDCLVYNYCKKRKYPL